MPDNEVKIISAGATKLGVRRCAGTFEENTGISVRITFATAPKIINTILSEECNSDIVIAPDPTILKFEKSGHVIRLSGTTFGSVNVGVVVKQGAIEPNISSKEELKRAILTSKKILSKEKMNTIKYSKIETSNDRTQQSFVGKFLSSVKQKMYGKRKF